MPSRSPPICRLDQNKSVLLFQRYAVNTPKAAAATLTVWLPRTPGEAAFHVKQTLTIIEFFSKKSKLGKVTHNHNIYSQSGRCTHPVHGPTPIVTPCTPRVHFSTLEMPYELAVTNLMKHPKLHATSIVKQGFRQEDLARVASMH
jgi:hypothetical protein